MDSEPSLETRNKETQNIWDHNAQFWDSHMGEGNAFQRQLIGPSVERLLALQSGESVLEIACGNGVFARRMAELGAQVTATDFSTQMLDLAKARTTATAYAERIDYQQLDATQEDHIVALGFHRFDAAICNMGLMDMAAIDPLIKALSQVLKPQGRFVFSVLHPCFNAGSTMGIELLEDNNGELATTYFVKISKYLSFSPQKGVVTAEQPLPHYYFHRSLHALFTSGFREGFVLDGLEEPAFPQEENNAHILRWTNFYEIPPVLIARMRLLQ